MTPLSPALLFGATVVFAAAMLARVWGVWREAMLAPPGEPAGLPLMLPPEATGLGHGKGVDLAVWLFDPGQTVLLLLLTGMTGSLLLMGVQVLGVARAQRQAPPALQALHAYDHDPSEHAPLTVALLAGAFWPGLLAADRPGLALAAALVMLMAALAAVIRGERHGNAVRRRLAVGLFSGWAMVAFFAVFACALVVLTGLPAELVASLALVMGAAAGIAVQIRLGRAPGFSVAVIVALAGIAIAAGSGHPGIAIVAVAGVAALTGVVVRAAT